MNILRCLKGSKWGADRAALKALYIGLIRSVLDYGSVAKALLSNLDKIQYQALRLCCEAIKTALVSTMQVEMGEQLLEIRRHQIALNDCTKLKGHSEKS